MQKNKKKFSYTYTWKKIKFGLLVVVVNHIYSLSPIEICFYKIMAEVMGQGGETERGVIAHLFFFYENMYVYINLRICIFTSVYIDTCKLLSVRMNTSCSFDVKTLN